MRVVVDQERLAAELEEGIDRSGCSWIYPREYLLRAPICGLVSNAIAMHLKRQDVTAKVMSTHAGLDPNEGIEHDLAIIGVENRHVIDACPSQFLGYVGLTWQYEQAMEEQLFPEEKIVSFEASKPEVIADWLTKAALDFDDAWPVDSRPPLQWHERRIDIGPLSGAPEDVIYSAYRNIYDESHYLPAQSSISVIDAAKSISTFITSGSIEVT